MKESGIERYLVEQVKKRGGEIRKVEWIGRRGAPDRRVMHPRLGSWVELKAPGKRATAEQQREHDRMREQGEIVNVFNSIAQIDDWLSFCSKLVTPEQKSPASNIAVLLRKK